jgi:ElaB/YqjD/DUF883 family membrane-anchored ribosome-binding protein
MHTQGQEDEMSESSQEDLAQRRRGHPSSEPSETTRTTLPERAAQVSQSAADAAVHRIQAVRERAQGSFEQQRERVASTIDRVSRAIEFVGDEVRSQDESAAEYLEQASARMRQVATYVSTASPGTLRKDVTSFAREHPSLALGGSFVVGIALGRFFHASTSTPQRSGRDHKQRSATGEARSHNGRKPMAMVKADNEPH